MLLFLLIIKNYHIQDATYSEVDSMCQIDSFSKLQIPGESTKWSVDIWRGHVSDWQNRIWCAIPRALIPFSLLALLNAMDLTQGSYYQKHALPCEKAAP